MSCSIAKWEEWYQSFIHKCNDFFSLSLSAMLQWVSCLWSCYCCRLYFLLCWNRDIHGSGSKVWCERGPWPLATCCESHTHLPCCSLRPLTSWTEMTFPGFLGVVLKKSISEIELCVRVARSWGIIIVEYFYCCYNRNYSFYFNRS